MNFTRQIISAAFVALLISGLAAQSATACETLDSRGAVWPLETNQPIKTKSAKILRGFGPVLNPITARYSLHEGVDWQAERGAPVLAVASGRISAMTIERRDKKQIVIDHGAGWQTVYRNFDVTQVNVDDCVSAGQRIGTVGLSDFKIPTIHFELRLKGKAVDPKSVPIREASAD